MSTANTIYVYIGSYAEKDDQGIYVYTLDRATGKLSPVSSVAGIENPSFLTMTPDQSYVYAVSETTSEPGAVAAFAVDPQSKELTLLNQQSTGGAAPCHLIFDGTHNHLVVVNYSGGSICLYPLDKDGRIGKLADTIQHHGQSINPDRQEAAHPHSANLTPDGTHIFVPDLGQDKIFCYKIDEEAQKLVLQGETTVKAGSGPRHFTFHPTRNYAYVINELSSTITAFMYEPATQSLYAIQTISTLPEGYQGESTAAEIKIHPSGKFLYGSNRGHDSIVTFALDATSGLLTLIGHISSFGETPRNFALTPEGDFLLVANQDGNNVVTYKLDGQTGKVSTTKEIVDIAHPVCIQIMN
ncbi:hypothetical protein KDA_63120 [Dictyobacter alpinus]|uniref:6-phosphogluconolactonase n=1 Tax=Dictyobacter alpinus TaxID=2014873 RepID=A0A402BHC9_9CHLR|nr:lactonase family protein [Dictyobacter alpinus]GCE30828.1 hypothetical protein KDA_63120 [Dictyobacter alpinus]